MKVHERAVFVAKADGSDLPAILAGLAYSLNRLVRVLGALRGTDRIPKAKAIQIHSFAGCFDCREVYDLL
jgi:hypothetical protein